MKKICHVTTVHKRYDPRIYQKEAKSLALLYEVCLVVNDGLGDEYRDNINIYDLNSVKKGKISRIFGLTRKLKKLLIDINADLYHLHDPELLRLSNFLHKKSKLVIFDSHEDYPLTILVKEWIPSILRKFISKLYIYIERKYLNKVNGAICCYHWTKERYDKQNILTELIFNFPILSNISNNKSFKSNSNLIMCYAGLISDQWQHDKIISVLSKIPNLKYKLAGKGTNSYIEGLKKMDGWENVDYYGFLSSAQVKSEIYNKSNLGVAILDYIPQCKGNIGNLSNTKIFEYMENELPILCTDFILWKQIVDKYDCGYYINPHDEKSFYNLLSQLVNKIDDLAIKGKNGRVAVEMEYNWSKEERKLFDFYEKIFR